jgi:small-conductance mechanosensitive channel
MLHKSGIHSFYNVHCSVEKSPLSRHLKASIPFFQKLSFLFILFALSISVAIGQKDTVSRAIDTIPLVPSDSVPITKIKRKISNDSIQALTRIALQKSVEKNLQEFEKDKLVAKQDKFFAELSIELENTTEYLKRGIDSVRLEKEISNIIKWYKVAADGIFVNQGTSQTSRNLTITHIILTEAIKRLDVRFEETKKYLGDLNNHKKKLDSLLSDSTLIAFPKDSAAFEQFFEKAVHSGGEIRIVYKNLKNAIGTMQELNARCHIVHNTLRIKLDEIEQFRKNLSNNAFKREFSNIWGPIGFNRPVSEIVKISWEKNLIVMGFYLANHLSYISILGLLTIALALFLKYLYKKGSAKLDSGWDESMHKILSHAWLISIFVMLNVCQFFFKNPPFLFYASGWLISALILTYLFWEKINPSLHLPWVLLLTLFIATILINSLLQASRPERWIVLFLAIAIFVSAIYSSSRLKTREGNNRFVIIFVYIVIGLEAISVLLNMFGRYNLAKTALTSGIFNLVVVVLLLWTCYYITEIIKIIAHVFNFGENKESEEPLEHAPKGLLNFPTFLNILLLAGWFILFMRNFYAFKLFTDPFRDLMETERTLGAYTFSIQSIFNFFLIMFVATLLSKVISFFASNKHDNPRKIKKGMGSWLLLVRIIIFSIALFLAFASAGIQMDKIAIIFSALSVGIGFGLQTLVNNLVSGLIIAFEKPVNVGDAVDINGQSGVMKSIGFRSSVISTYDGSDIIIPNGDLLNAHLINWTLGDTKRRVEVLVGVAYGTDIEKVKAILMNILETDVRILRYPDPTILVKEFASSSVDFRLLFWIDTAYHLWSGVKSDVLEQIDIHFKKEGIEIPFAQQDVHIRSGLPGLEGKKDEPAN